MYAWLEWNLNRSSTNNRFQGDWDIFFGVSVWNIWKDRNSLVFSKKTDIGGNFFPSVTSQVKFINKKLSKNSPLYVEKLKTYISISWKPPAEGVFKMNVDGSFRSSEGNAACRGLICDSMGKFLKAFHCNLGFYNVIWSELWALRLGIILACDLCLTRVIFELDSSVVVHMVHTGTSSTCFLRPLLQEVVSFLKLPDWETSVIHSYREGNRCVDLLANLGHGGSFTWCVLNEAPHSLRLLLLEDAMGCSSPRLVSFVVH